MKRHILEEFVKYFLEKNGGILVMNKEKALKNQGLEFREDIDFSGGGNKEEKH